MRREVEARLAKEQEEELAWGEHFRIMNKKSDLDYNKASSQRARNESELAWEKHFRLIMDKKRDRD